MDEVTRLLLLQLATDQGLRLERHWVNEWIKERRARRGRYRKRLKYYWLQECGLLLSGPFYSQEEALLYLAHNFHEGNHDVDRLIYQHT